MKHLFAAILFVALFFTNTTQAQNMYVFSTQNETAIELYNTAQSEIDVNSDYAKGLDLLYQALDIAPEFLEALEAVRETLNMLRDYNKLVETCDKISQSPDLDVQKRNENRYILAHALYHSGNYDRALAEFQTAKEFANEDQADEISEMLQRIAASKEIMKSQYKLDFVPINRLNTQAYNEMYPTLVVGERTLLYTRNTPGVDAALTEDIYFSRKLNDTWYFPFPLSESVNTQVNETYPHISTDGKTLYFSSSDDSDLNFGSDDLFYSEKKDGAWSSPVNLGRALNSDEWDGHPTLSNDGQIIIFSSNRDGGFGGLDLWMSVKDDDNRWSEPKNLGEHINTPGDELAPSLHFAGKSLYFSSDGHNGLGGFDVFVCKRNHKGEWGMPSNLGYPINKGGDQFKLAVSADGNIAYQARVNPESNTYDIYKFVLPDHLALHLEATEKDEVLSISRNFESRNKLSFNNSIVEWLNPNVLFKAKYLDATSKEEVSDVITTIKMNDMLYAQGAIDYITLDTSQQYSIHINKFGYDTIAETLDPSTDTAMTFSLVRNADYTGENTTKTVYKEKHVFEYRTDTVFVNTATGKANIKVVKDTVYLKDPESMLAQQVPLKADTVFVKQEPQIIVKRDTVFQPADESLLAKIAQPEPDTIFIEKEPQVIVKRDTIFQPTDESLLAKMAQQEPDTIYIKQEADVIVLHDTIIKEKIVQKELAVTDTVFVDKPAQVIVQKDTVIKKVTKVQQIAVGAKGRYFECYFKFGKTKLTKKYKVIMKGIARKLAKRKDLSCSVCTFTDSKGSERANREISIKRAKYIFNLLTKYGVSPSRIKLTSYTESTKYKSDKKNRRAEISLY